MYGRRRCCFGKASGWLNGRPQDYAVCSVDVVCGTVESLRSRDQSVSPREEEGGFRAWIGLVGQSAVNTVCTDLHCNAPTRVVQVNNEHRNAYTSAITVESALCEVSGRTAAKCWRFSR